MLIYQSLYNCHISAVGQLLVELRPPEAYPHIGLWYFYLGGQN